MTVGDLTPNMIGKARIRVTTRETVVEGLLSRLDIETRHRDAPCMNGTRVVKEFWEVRVTVTIGSVTLNDLPCETPCEVIE